MNRASAVLNACPPRADLHQGIWLDLEKKTGKWAAEKRWEKEQKYREKLWEAEKKFREKEWEQAKKAHERRKKAEERYWKEREKWTAPPRWPYRHDRDRLDGMRYLFYDGHPEDLDETRYYHRYRPQGMYWYDEYEDYRPPYRRRGYGETILSIARRTIKSFSDDFNRTTLSRKRSRK